MFDVAVYELDLCYGGAEEGGWWYSAGQQMRVIRRVRNETQAYDLAYRINRLLSYRRSKDRYFRPLSSVAYQGGHYEALVYKSPAPPHFPQHRPHYE